MEIVWEQKVTLLLAAPFMFFGGVTDFLFPNLIANLIDSMKEGDREKVYYYLKMWMGVIAVGSVATMLNSYLFGLTSERLGRALRNRLFKSLLKKDVAFYDEARTGELLSRLNSDTQVVQDGLSTAIALFIRSFCIIIAMIVIMFTYSRILTVYALLLILPSICSNRVFMYYTQSLNEKYQSSKSELGGIA